MNEDRLVRLASVFLQLPVDGFDEGLDRALAELAGLDWVLDLIVELVLNLGLKPVIDLILSLDDGLAVELVV